MEYCSVIHAFASDVPETMKQVDSILSELQIPDTPKRKLLKEIRSDVSTLNDDSHSTFSAAIGDGDIRIVISRIVVGEAYYNPAWLRDTIPVLAGLMRNNGYSAIGNAFNPVEDASQKIN